MRICGGGALGRQPAMLLKTYLTSIEEDLKSLESEGVAFPVAKQMFFLMVQSIFSGKTFSVAHFATTGIYSFLYVCIIQLEVMSVCHMYNRINSLTSGTAQLQSILILL